MRKPAAITFALLTSASPVLAQAIDLSKAYGSPSGCSKAPAPTSPDADDDRLLLTADTLQLGGTQCTFVQKLTTSDGTLVVMGLCQLQGEAGGRAVTHFSIVRSKGNPAGLGIYDEYGSEIGQIDPCP